MKALIFAALLVGTYSAQGWECDQNQIRQGCYTDNSDNSSGEVSWQCRFDYLESTYACPVCAPEQRVDVQTQCKTVTKNHCSHMGGCFEYPETVCQSRVACVSKGN